MDKLEDLKREYAEQDNRYTAYPIFVTVQELVCIGVIANGYSVNCPFGDGEIRYEYTHPDYEGVMDSKSDLIDCLMDGEPGKSRSHFEDDVEEITSGYVWVPVEFFLTIKGAEEYIRCNKHNHGKLRTYVHHLNERNFEMRGLLETLGFKIKD